MSAVNAELDFVNIYYKECIVTIPNKNFALVGFYSSTLNGRREDVQQCCIGLHKQMFEMEGLVLLFTDHACTKLHVFLNLLVVVACICN